MVRPARVPRRKLKPKPQGHGALGSEMPATAMPGRTEANGGESRQSRRQVAVAFAVAIQRGASALGIRRAQSGLQAGGQPWPDQ